MKKSIILFTLTVLYLLQTTAINTYAEELSSAPEPPLLSSDAATLMDADTGIVLYGQMQDEPQYPASITKIMTALITLEQCKLDETVLFSHDAVYSLPRDASHIAMDEDETLSVYDALHGLLIASGNEVANALAEHVAGTVEAFAEMMNKRAKALGAVNTNFVNPSGLFEEEHQTTAYDMALIMREAVKHDAFNEIIAKRRHDIAPTERKSEVRELLNTNDIIFPGKFYNEYVVGGKTGFTSEAMHTLVNYAKKDGRSLIVSVMHGGTEGVYEDTLALLDYGFGLPYKEQLVLDSASYLRTLPVYGEVAGEVQTLGEAVVMADNNLTFNLPEGFDPANINYASDLPQKLEAPVKAGEIVGTVTCSIQNMKIGEVTFRTVNSIYTPDGNAELLSANEKTAGDTAVEVFEQGAVPVDLTAEEAAYDAGDMATVDVLSIFDTEYLATLALPIGLALLMLLLSFIAFLRRHKRKNRMEINFDKYTDSGGNFYKYKQ
jgi:D-alanyl-D-alanine carboxypeptidase